MYAKTIHSVSFPKAWEEAVKFVRKSPEKLVFGGGKEVKYAVDSQTTIILDEHAVRDVLNHIVHPSDPFATENKLREYISEYSDAYDASIFDYTYYDMLKKGFWGYYSTGIGLKSDFNQIEALRFGLEKQICEKISSNRNVAVLYNPITHTHSSGSSPCWNEVLIRYRGDNKVQIYLHWRSHDLFTAWGGNMISIIEFLNRDVVKPCGCEISEVIETNFSLHIYEYDLPAAMKIKEMPINPALQRLQNKYDRINCSTIFNDYLDSKGL